MLTTTMTETANNVEPQKERIFARLSSWGFTLLKVGLSALAISIVMLKVDLSATWERMANQDLHLIALVMGIMILQIGTGGMRWHVILRRLGVPATVVDSMRLFYISVFFNTCLWGAVSGDVMRAWLSYRAQANVKIAAVSVILDRVATLAGVAVLVLATAPFFMMRVNNTIVVVVPTVIAAGGLLGIVVVAQFDRLPIRWQHWRPLRLLQVLGGATRTIFLRPSAALLTLALAVAAQTLMAISAYFVAISLQIELSLLDCLVLMQPVALITALPISVGGWGVRETAMIGLFGLVGVPSSAALVLSVQLGLLGILMSSPGLLLWLMVKFRTGAPMKASPTAGTS